MLILTCLFLSMGFVWAQTTKISGTVVDNNGEAVIGASVVVKGTTIGTSTGLSGEFSIDMPDGKNTLVFNFLGMKSVERTATNGMRVIMEHNEKILDDVVVVGYGSAKKAGTIVGSVVSVSSETIKDRPSANVMDALQGQVSGMQVYTSSGEPSETSSIRIHGSGTLTGNSAPLYILDGAPVPAESVLAMNSSDFESVNILKDASATSIYGARAANGVILLTSKMGKRNSKPVVNIKGQYSIANLASRKFLDNFMSTDELLNYWGETGIRNEATINSIRENYGHNNFDWSKYVYEENVPTYELNASVIGGGERVSYFVSAGMLDKEGLAYRSKYNRYNFRSNIDFSVSDQIRMGLNLALGYNSRAKNPDTANSTSGGISFMLPPFYSPYDEDGNEYYEKTVPGLGMYTRKYRKDKFPYDENQINFNGSYYFQYRPIENLNLRSQHSLDGLDYRLNQQRLSSHVGAFENGYVKEEFAREYTYTMTNTAEYKFSLADRKHDFTILLGQEWIDFKANRFGTTLYGYTDDRMTLLGQASNNPEYVGYGGEYAYLSFFGRADYSLLGKYFFDASIRNDRASTFGKNKRSGWFGAVGAMWKMKEENFMKDLKFINQLDLKLTYGTSGNSDAGRVDDNGYDYYYPSVATIANDNYQGRGWVIGEPGNPELGWESQEKLVASITASMFNSRLNLDLQYYNRKTSDMIISVPLPYTSGVSSVTKNIASMTNSGIDLTISYEVLKGKNYSLRPYINYNYNKQKITKLFPEASGNGKYWIRSNSYTTWAVGQAVSLYMPLFAGIDPADGLPMWYVPGDDPTVQRKEETTKEFNDNLAQYTGSTLYAPHVGGFGLSGSYKDFTLNVDFSFVKGKYIINNDRFFSENPRAFAGYNTSKDMWDYWKEPGDNARFPKASYLGYWTEFDDRLIEDGSFIRLKNLTVGYSIPQKIVRGTKYISNIRLFATGRNLLTITNYNGKDPEIDSNLTTGVNPQTREYSFGIEVTF